VRGVKHTRFFPLKYSFLKSKMSLMVIRGVPMAMVEEAFPKHVLGLPV